MAGGSSEPGRSVTSKVLAILEVFETPAQAVKSGAKLWSSRDFRKVLPIACSQNSWPGGR